MNVLYTSIFIFEEENDKNRYVCKDWIGYIYIRNCSINSFDTKKVDDDKVIGTVSILNIDYERQMTDWSFGLGAAYWGKGYSLEMLELTKKYIFEELCLNRIYGCTHVENEGVINLLLAIGAEQEGIARQVYRNSNGKYYDGWTYSILAEEYLKNEVFDVDVDDSCVAITMEMIDGKIS